MTPGELSSEVEAIIAESERAFGAQVASTQRALFEQVQIMLSKLDLTTDGIIKQSQANRQILSRANIYFEKALNQGYYSSLNDFPEIIDNIFQANMSYFSFVKDAFSIDAQYLKSLQKSTIDTLESLLANDGLESVIKRPILDIMNANINTGAKYSDLVKQLKNFIIGDAEQQGKLMTYSGQIVTDTLFNYSRAIQEAISVKTGLQFVVYSGGLMDDSRDFCIERAENYYHKEEVSLWAQEDWQGKRRGTTESTIFIYAGGYRCNHQIIYVSELIVPEDVVSRAKESGFYS
jgi:hypothetical protein